MCYNHTVTQERLAGLKVLGPVLAQGPVSRLTVNNPTCKATLSTLKGESEMPNTASCLHTVLQHQNSYLRAAVPRFYGVLVADWVLEKINRFGQRFNTAK